MLMKFLLWLDEKYLCPHALVERVLGDDAGPRWDWLYGLGLRACTWLYDRD
jgi:hypothetical protein